MKRILTVAVMAASGSAVAGFESMMNPMAMTNPFANPLTMAVPLGAGLIAPGLIGSPFGFGSPLPGMGLPGMGGVMHPAMQVAPNLMSFQHQAPQMMTNPYLGGPFSQLPFAHGSRSTPFFGTSAPAPASPYAATLPMLLGLLASQGTAPAQPAIPYNPYLKPAPAQPTPAAMYPSLLQLNPAAWMQPTMGQPTPAATQQKSSDRPTPWQQAAPNPPQAVAPSSAFDPSFWLAPLLLPQAAPSQ